MTEQEAYDKGYKQGYADRIEMEKALRVEDCISREALKDIISEWIENDCYSKGEQNIMRCVLVEIEDAPSVKPTRAKGKWRPIMQGDCIIGYRCTNCELGHSNNKFQWNFCPNCGADMRENEVNNV